MHIRDVDHWSLAQQAAETHLGDCLEFLHAGGECEPESAGPFCGCLTCIVREVLFAAHPHARTAIQTELKEEDFMTTERTYGMCTACDAVEVALVKATGTRDLSTMGEHHAYPTGYGCEACS